MECRIQNRIKLSSFLYKWVLFFELIVIFFFSILIVYFKIISDKGGSQELPLNGEDWKHNGDVQSANVECMEVCEDHTTILPKGTSRWLKIIEYSIYKPFEILVSYDFTDANTKVLYDAGISNGQSFI